MSHRRGERDLTVGADAGCGAERESDARTAGMTFMLSF
jgi:hypothetical protein